MYTLEPNQDYLDQNQRHTTQLALHNGCWDKSTPYKQHQALLNKNQIICLIGQ